MTEETKPATHSLDKRIWWCKAFDDRTKNNFHNYFLYNFVCLDELGLLKKYDIKSLWDTEQKDKITKLASKMAAESEGRQYAPALVSFLYEAKLGDLVFIRNNPEKQFAVGIIDSEPLWTNVSDKEVLGSYGGSMTRFAENPSDPILYRKVTWKWVGSTNGLARNKAGKVGYLCSLRCFSAIGEGKLTVGAKEDVAAHATEITQTDKDKIEEKAKKLPIQTTATPKKKEKKDKKPKDEPKEKSNTKVKSTDTEKKKRKRESESDTQEKTPKKPRAPKVIPYRSANKDPQPHSVLKCPPLGEHEGVNKHKLRLEAVVQQGKIFSSEYGQLLQRLENSITTINNSYEDIEGVPEKRSSRR